MSLNSLSNVGSNLFAQSISTFSPTLISNLVGWWDADDSNTIFYTGSNVTRWGDKSGNFRDVSSNGTIAVTPGIRINGRNTLRFIGTGSLATPNTFTQSNSRSTFVVYRFPTSNFPADSNQSYVQTLVGGNTSPYAMNVRIFRSGSTGNTWSNAINVGNVGDRGLAQLDNTASGPNSRVMILGQTFDSASGPRIITSNGIVVSSNAGAVDYPFNTNDFIWIGQDCYGGQFGEVVYYNGGLSTTDRQKVEGYLAWKWGVDLSSSHPYFSAPPVGSSSATTTPFANMSVDRYNNLLINASNTVAVSRPLEYRDILIDVGQALSLSAANDATTFRLQEGTTSTVSVATGLGGSDAGMFWKLLNVSGAGIRIAITGTTDIASPVIIPPSSTYTIRWNGYNYFGTLDSGNQQPTTENFMLAVANGGRAFYTVDGFTWRQCTGTPTGDALQMYTWNGLYWLGGSWGTGNGYMSSDGITWTTMTQGSNNCGSEPAWNGSIWVKAYANQGVLHYSQDGKNWTLCSNISFFSGSDIMKVTWGKDKFVCVGTGGRAGYSADGITWTTLGTPFGASANIMQNGCLAHNGFQWVAGIVNGSFQVYSSSDGITWSGSSPFPTSPLRAVDWNGTYWMGVFEANSSNYAYISSNGTSWSAVTTPRATNGAYGVCWNGNSWNILVQNYTFTSGVDTQHIHYRSTDNGSNWTRVAFLQASGGGGMRRMYARRVPPGVGAFAPTSAGQTLFPSTSTYDSNSNITSLTSRVQMRYPVTEVSGTSLTIDLSSNFNRNFYLTNTGFNALSLPAATPQSFGGVYWTLRNATATNLNVTLTNTLSLASPLIIPALNTQTLVVSDQSTNTILLF
jgi:hypothetical protein